MRKRDGDGRIVRSYENRTVVQVHPAGSSTSEETEYYVRSSVLGGQILTEVNGTGGKIKTRVYAGSGVIAEQIAASSSVVWRHTDAVTGSFDSTGTFPPSDPEFKAEFEPLGAVLPETDPNPDPQTAPMPNRYKYGGDFSDPESGCMVNYARTSCTQMTGLAQSWGLTVLGGFIVDTSVWRYTAYQLFDNESIEGNDRANAGENWKMFGRAIGIQVGKPWYEIYSNLVPLPQELDRLALADKIRLTKEEVEAVRDRVQSEVTNNEICAKFIERLAFATLGKVVSAKDLLNEGIDRANSTLGIYWSAYPGAGGVATSHKIGTAHANVGEIWYSSKKGAMFPPNVAGLIHEIIHVAARANDIEISRVVKKLGIEVTLDDGKTVLAFPTDKNNSNLAYSGYWGQALKNHCGPGTILGRDLPR